MLMVSVKTTILLFNVLLQYLSNFFFFFFSSFNAVNTVFSDHEQIYEVYGTIDVMKIFIQSIYTFSKD